MASSSAAIEELPKKKKRRGIQQRRRQRFEKEGLDEVKQAIVSSIEDSDTDALELCVQDAAQHIAKAGKRESAVQQSAQYKQCEEQLEIARAVLAQRKGRKALAKQVASGSDEAALQQTIAEAHGVGLDDIADQATQFCKYWFGEARVVSGIPDSEENPYYDDVDMPTEISAGPLPDMSPPIPEGVFVLGSAPKDCLSSHEEPLVCIFGLFKRGTKTLAE